MLRKRKRVKYEHIIRDLGTVRKQDHHLVGLSSVANVCVLRPCSPRASSFKLRVRAAGANLGEHVLEQLWSATQASFEKAAVTDALSRSVPYTGNFVAIANDARRAATAVRLKVLNKFMVLRDKWRDIKPHMSPTPFIYILKRRLFLKSHHVLYRN